MLSSSVHPLSIHSSNRRQLLTTTPATSKQQSFNLQRTLQRTAASKPRDFDIYIDHNSSSSELDLVPTRSAIRHTPHHRVNHNKQSIKVGLATSTKKTNTKPLEDKTNTIRKKLSRVRIDDHSPTSHKSVNPETHHDPQSILKNKSSTSPILSTPHPNKSLKLKKSPSTNQLSSSRNDPIKRLLYRTPVTCKRAPRPPLADNLGNEANEDGDNGQVSLVNSDHSINHLDFDLNQDNIPDVEYGPPSAITEPIEHLIDEQESEIKMQDFFRNLKENPSNYMIAGDDAWKYDASRSQVVTEIEEIMNTDGCKEQWIHEPRCEITNYTVDDLLDEFLIPSETIRQPDKPAKRQQPMSLSSRSSRLAGTRSNSSAHLSASTKPPTLSRTRSKAQLLPPSTRHSSRNLAKVSCCTSQSSNRAASKLRTVAQYQQLVQTLIHDHHTNLDSDLDLLHSNLDDSSHAFDQDLNSFQFDLIV